MQHKYVIVETFFGTVTGTDDLGMALDFSADPEIYVIDTQNGTRFVNRRVEEIPVRVLGVD